MTASAVGVETVGVTDTRQRLIDAAIELCTRYTFAGTSLQMIADELGFTKAAIYHHFRTTRAAARRGGGTDPRAAARDHRGRRGAAFAACAGRVYAQWLRATGRRQPRRVGACRRSVGGRDAARPPRVGRVDRAPDGTAGRGESRPRRARQGLRRAGRNRRRVGPDVRRPRSRSAARAPRRRRPASVRPAHAPAPDHRQQQTTTIIFRDFSP